MNEDKIKKYWERFVEVNDDVSVETPYDYWYFGHYEALAQELAELVITGKKTATASLLKSYEVDEEDIPEAGQYSVITDYHGNPMCIIRTNKVRIMPFNEMTAELAALEGEGDLSLKYWQDAHVEAFTYETKSYNGNFDISMDIVFEIFEVVYK